MVPVVIVSPSQPHKSKGIEIHRSIIAIFNFVVLTPYSLSDRFIVNLDFFYVNPLHHPAQLFADRFEFAVIVFRIELIELL